MLGFFGTDSSGIAKTFLVHGLAYAVFMSLGWLLVRVPRPDWKPRDIDAGGNGRRLDRGRWPGLRQ